MKTPITLALIGLLMGFAPWAAPAVTVRGTVSGEVFQATGTHWQVGDVLSGFYEFDTDFIDPATGIVILEYGTTHPVRIWLTVGPSSFDSARFPNPSGLGRLEIGAGFHVVDAIFEMTEYLLVPGEPRPVARQRVGLRTETSVRLEYLAFSSQLPGDSEAYSTFLWGDPTIVSIPDTGSTALLFALGIAPVIFLRFWGRPE